jgi:hypothetical protein
MITWRARARQLLRTYPSCAHRTKPGKPGTRRSPVTWGAALVRSRIQLSRVPTLGNAPRDWAAGAGPEWRAGPDSRLEQFTLVTFSAGQPHVLTSPQWCRMADADLERLIGAPAIWLASAASETSAADQATRDVVHAPAELRTRTRAYADTVPQVAPVRREIDVFGANVQLGEQTSAQVTADADPAARRRTR